MKTRVVALTGGIGSGKSAVCREFSRLGAAIVDADALAREVVAPGSEGLREVVELLGPEVCREDGSLDRPRVAALVFQDPERRAALEGIIHPRVRERLTARVAGLVRAARHELLVLDIPLLFETGREQVYEQVIVVSCPTEQRVKRLVQQRGLAEEDVRARIAAQLSLTEKAERADLVIDNSGSRAVLRAQVERAWQRLFDD